MHYIPERYPGYCMDLESTCEEDHCRCRDIIKTHRAAREVANEMREELTTWKKSWNTVKNGEE